MIEKGEILIIERGDLIVHKQYDPINEIRPSHLREKPYQKFKEAGIVIIKAEGKTALLKSRYDLEDVCHSYLKQKNKIAWTGLF